MSGYIENPHSNSHSSHHHHTIAENPGENVHSLGHRLNSVLTGGKDSVVSDDIKERILRRPVIPYASRLGSSLLKQILLQKGAVETFESHLIVDANHAVKKLR